MKLLYLHGIGELKLDRSWLRALNESLSASNYLQVTDGQVIAPHYYGLLQTRGLKAKHTEKTYQRPKGRDEVLARMAFERRPLRRT
jgi:hypothetical protein